MISFYPGPSKVYPAVGGFMQEAFKSGILSVNHRSKEFVDLSESTIILLKKKLGIPKDYFVFYTSSATECWEIIAQSLIKEKSVHLYNGAFGEKWFEYTQKIKSSAQGFSFDVENKLDVKSFKDTELICLVQNETSNGSQISNKIVGSIKEKNPHALIAVDATSSLAGIKLEIKNADIWFASVQKCFGLPAGMALMICSPKAMQRALHINESNHYNSLTFLIEKMKDWQTSYTPNVLSVFLLNKTLDHTPSMTITSKLMKDRAKQWYEFFEKFELFQPLIKETSLRSDTVITIKGTESDITKIKVKAKKEGILLGNGYGEWSKSTFRIANFPAITDKEILTLKRFFQKNIQ